MIAPSENVDATSKLDNDSQFDANAQFDPDAPIVQVNDLRKTYKRRFSNKRIEALRGVSLTSGRGEVFGLLGPNGAGKTTMIKTLLGIIAPTGGSARLFGLPIGSRQARMRVGYLPESLRIDRHHTARTALRYYGKLSHLDGDTIRRRSDELLDLVGLQGRDNESVRRFSKGMYQRLGLAQALMHDPDLLILDEPTDGLDPVGRNEVRTTLEKLRERGKTIFLNSHILQEVEMVCTRVAILAGGTLRAIGTIDEIRGADGKQSQLRLAIVPSDDDAAERLKLWLASPVANGLNHVDARTHVPPVMGSGMTSYFVAPVEGQSRVDAIVDSIRAANLSITSLAVVEPTLEDRFMQLVQTPTL